MVAQHSIIDAQDLSKIYQMGSTEVPALRGVSLRVKPGEMVAIMGASGSGKSTLMNILGCLDRPTSGRYLLDGTRVDELGRSRLAQIRNERIGFVFQTFNLLPRSSAIENVELPLLYNRSGLGTSVRALAAAALERVGLADRMEHEPSELSGGQQQRVAIARALVTQPALLLADEPTGNLDTQTSLEVMALFQELNREGTTMILVTHEHDIAAYARRIIELRDGRIVRDDGVAARRDAATDLAGVAPADEGSVS
jgi:putative ABC transport system ATP-binding protein